MPKVVDHDGRREEIVDATWRLLQREGFEGLTMRQIAAEAGFAHGALKAYFPDKQAILQAAFDRAHARTDARAGTSLRAGGARGLAAIRALCHEIMPLTDETRAEARVVVAFWDRATTDSSLWTSHHRANLMWRAQLAEFLAQARADGEVDTPMTDEQVVGLLASSNAGLQVLCLLLPERTAADELVRTLDAFLTSIATAKGRAVLAAEAAGGGGTAGR